MRVHVCTRDLLCAVMVLRRAFELMYGTADAKDNLYLLSVVLLS